MTLMNIKQESILEFPLENKTVLLIDDESRLRQIVAMMLEELGGKVISVDNGEEAVSVYKTKQSQIDLILLDLCMTGMDGKEVYRIIKNINKNIKIALSSGLLPEQSFLDLLKNDGAIFIEKPFDMDKLSSEIFQLMYN